MALQCMELVRKSNLLLNSKSARDKLYKTTQYGAKIVLETTNQYGLQLRYNDKLTKLVKRLGQARSLFRFLGFLTSLENLINNLPRKLTVKTLESLVVSTAQVLSDIFDSCACWCDVFGIQGSWNRQRCGWWSGFFWYFVILSTLRRTVVQLFELRKKRISDNTDKQELQKELDRQQTDLLVALTKCVFDFGHAVSITNETFAKNYKLLACWCGFVGGFCGLIQNWRKLPKI